MSELSIVLGDYTPPDERIEEFELKTGVRLYFMRYGIFPKGHSRDSGFEHLTKLDENTIDYFLDSEFKFNEFHCHLTDLMADGYIYIIDPKHPSPKESFEYKVLGSQNLEEIPWYENNVRNTIFSNINPRNAVNLPYHPVEFMEEEPPTLYVTYSQVQWSVALYKSMCKDQSMQKKYMKKVVCDGIPQGQTNIDKEILAFDGLSGMYYDNDFGCERMRIKRAYLQHNHNPMAEKKLDLFIPLFDPLGAADDIQLAVMDAFLEHEANIEAMRFGTDPKDIIERLKKGENKGELTKREQEMNNMFHLALSTYQLVYNDPKSVKKYDGGRIGKNVFDSNAGEEHEDTFYYTYPISPIGGASYIKMRYIGNGVYKPKLLNALGVEERKQQRKKIRRLQKDFIALLDSAYFDRHIETLYMVDNSICALVAKEKFADYLYWISLNPHFYDRSLDLSQDYERDHEPTNWVYQQCVSVKSFSVMTKVLDNELDITDLLETDLVFYGIKLPNKLASLTRKVLDNLSNMLAQERRGLMEITVGRLNRLTYRGDDMFDLQREQVIKALPEGHELAVVEGAGNSNLNRAKVLRVPAEGIVLKHSQRGAHTMDIPTTTSINKPLAKGLRKILESPEFNRVLVSLQAVNLAYGILKTSNNPNTKNAIGLAGAFASTWDAANRFSGVPDWYESKGIMTKTPRGRFFLGAPGIWAAGIGTVMCFWDGMERMAAGDEDAAYMYYGAGLTSAGVTVAAIHGALVLNSTLGPLGMVCTALAIGFLVAAHIFTDDAFEKIFKYYIFSDQVDFPAQGRLAWQYNRDLYANRQSQLGAKNPFPELVNQPTKAAAELHDALVAAKIEFKHRNLIRTDKKSQMISHKYGVQETKSSGYATHFEVHIYFKFFLHQKEQFTYELWYFKDGIAGSHRQLDAAYNSQFVAPTREKPAHIQLDITLDRELVQNSNPKSCLLLVCRIDMYKNSFTKVVNYNYYPISYDGKDRYLAAMVGIQFQHLSSSLLLASKETSYRTPTRIGSKEEVRKPPIWNKE
ncbi:MAG: hypothetical protein OIF50_08210 [Flavobacteriaceae bacterium]|nr:hypothetical protein [Flavobacteriaceae bacterium]